MASTNVVAYATIKSSMDDINASCDRMTGIANSMSTTIDDSIGQGKAAWDGASAKKFAADWHQFADNTFPEAKRELNRLVDEKMKIWMDQFQMSESEIEGVVASLAKTIG